MIGLGKMGANMAERLLRGGHEVVGFDLDQAAIQGLVARGAQGADSPADLVQKLLGLSLMGRIESRDEVEFADRLLASMRKGFGGHAITTEDPDGNA